LGARFPLRNLHVCGGMRRARPSSPAPSPWAVSITSIRASLGSGVSMKCCLSCRHWERASRKVPVDVERVRSSDLIEVRYGGRALRVEALDWKLAQPMRPRDLLARRLCLYGRGIVWPWSECANYVGKASSAEQSLCQAGLECEFSPVCPKLRILTSYVV